MKKSYVVMYQDGFEGFYEPLVTLDSKLNAELFCERANDNLRTFGVHYSCFDKDSYYFRTVYVLTSHGTVLNARDCDADVGFKIRYPGARVSFVEVEAY